MRLFNLNQRVGCRAYAIWSRHSISTRWFKICFKTTTNSSVYWLQFRSLHRFIPVKKYLKKINTKISDWCVYCMENFETLIHVFISVIQCKKWDWFQAHINYIDILLRIGFNVSNIIFGELPLSDNEMVLHFIILYVKQYRCYTLSAKNAKRHLRIKHHREKWC